MLFVNHAAMGCATLSRDEEGGAMHNEPSPIHDWLRRYLTAWRAACANASESARKHALTFRAQDLRAPVQFEVTVCSDPSYPFCVTALTLVRDHDAPDGEVTLEIEGPDALASRDDDRMRMLVDYFANMRANYTPGRELDPPTRAGSFMHHSIGGWGWILPDDLPRLSVEELVAHQFREPAPQVVQPQPAFAQRHLYALGQAREESTSTTWLESPTNLGDLLRALGIRGPCWYAVNLLRSKVNERSKGDFDFVAGELRFDLTADEFAARRATVAATYPLSAHPSWINQETIAGAVRDGCVAWPPSADATLAGVEVKVSRFDGTQNLLKTTHENEGPQIMGQLEELRSIGCARVGFLHLTVTRPRGGWGTADQDLSRAQEQLERLTPLFDPKGFGYFSAVLAAVSHQDERFAGSQTRLRTHFEPQTYEQAPASESARARLVQALSKLPSPRAFVQPIRVCVDCKTLFRAFAPSTDRCGCAGG